MPSFLADVYREVIAKYPAHRYDYRGGRLLVKYTLYNGDVKDGLHVTECHVTVLPDAHEYGYTFHVTVETSTAAAAAAAPRVDPMAAKSWRRAAAAPPPPRKDKYFVFYDFCGDRTSPPPRHHQRQRDEVAEIIAEDFKFKVDRALGI